MLLKRLRDTMARAGSVEETLGEVVRMVANEMIAEVCSIYLLRAGEVLELFATQGLNPDAVHRTRLRVGEGLVGDIAAHGRALALDDAQSHPQFAYRPETGEEIYHSLAGVPILRAGLGLLDGMLHLVPSARVAHLGLYRDHKTLEAVEYYCKLPEDIAERLAIVTDPMLATGNSSIAAVTRVKQGGAQAIKFVCLVAAPEGVAAMRKAHPDVQIYTAAIDERLNENAYIVPGLGDCGDRLFGTK